MQRFTHSESVRPEWAKRFAIALVVWSVVGFVHLMTGYFDTVSRYPAHRLQMADYAYYFLSYGSWALFSVALYTLLDKVPPGRMRLGYALMFAVGSVLWLPCYFTVDYLVNGALYSNNTATLIDKLAATPNALWFFYWIVFALTFGVCTSILQYRHAQAAQLNALKLETLRSEAELEIARQHVQILQSQLGPHFLFNCLGAISALVRTADKDALLNAVARVGNLLRYTVNASAHSRILLREEVDFVEDYIALQTLRFGHRFTFEMTRTGEQDNILIIPFLIQPMVENVFSHAVAHTEAQTHIVLHIAYTSNQLSVEVSNTHHHEVTATNGGLGSSLNNLQARLHSAFPDAYSLSQNIEQGHYCSALKLALEAC